MIYLAIFWSLFIISIFLYLFSILFKFKKFKFILEDYGVLFFLVLFLIAIMAIITNDPITIAGITIPTEIQWLGSLFVALFGSWKFYLNPLKSKVYEMDREVGEIKVSIEKVEKNVDKITDKLINNKVTLSSH